MGSARIKAKERKKKERQVRRAKKRKGIEEQRAKPSTPSQATDAHIGIEEQSGKQKKNKMKETGNGSHKLANPDHLVAFYGNPTLLTPHRKSSNKTRI